MRRRLLANKKFGRYLFYAIGEVIILITGIFFALQVDNWNEMWQKKTIEISILKAIKTGLEQDLVNLRRDDLPLLREVIASSQIIIEQLENNRPYNDSLAYHFLTSHLTTHIIYNKGAISTLKSIGINTITNEKIRDQIINLFDVRFDFLNYLGNAHDSSSGGGLTNILNSRFDQFGYFDDPSTEKEWDGAMVPLDYEGLKKDNEYLFYVKSYKNLTFYYLQIFLDIESEISQVISDIEEELKRLEK